MWVVLLGSDKVSPRADRKINLLRVIPSPNIIEYVPISDQNKGNQSNVLIITYRYALLF